MQNPPHIFPKFCTANTSPDTKPSCLQAILDIISSLSLLHTPIHTLSMHNSNLPSLLLSSLSVPAVQPIGDIVTVIIEYLNTLTTMWLQDHATKPTIDHNIHGNCSQEFKF